MKNGCWVWVKETSQPVLLWSLIIMLLGTHWALIPSQDNIVPSCYHCCLITDWTIMSLLTSRSATFSLLIFVWFINKEKPSAIASYLLYEIIFHQISDLIRLTWLAKHANSGWNERLNTNCTLAWFWIKLAVEWIVSWSSLNSRKLIVLPWMVLLEGKVPTATIYWPNILKASSLLHPWLLICILCVLWHQPLKPDRSNFY